MNTQTTRNLTTATVLALFALFGLLAIYAGFKVTAASLAVVGALILLATMEMRATGAQNRQRRKTRRFA